MTELHYYIATTLDGFIAGPYGEADESIFAYDGDLVSDFLESLKSYDTVLMGRKTYEYGYQYGMKPGEPSGVALASNPGMKHYIFSSSIDFTSNEKVELIREDAAVFVRNLKQKPDKKIWLCGGGKLAGSLLKAKLIDKLILKINPVLIGKGIPLFGNYAHKTGLKLDEAKSYDGGIILSSYKINYK